MAQEQKTVLEQHKKADAKPPMEFLEDPLDVSFEIVGKKWTVHILREAMQGSGMTRFNELLRKVKGINPKSLSARLKELEQAKILERRVVPGTPVHTEYHLTQKGWALKPILVAMAWYSLKWRPEDVLDKAKAPTDAKLWEALSVYCGEGGKGCGWPYEEGKK